MIAAALGLQARGAAYYSANFNAAKLPATMEAEALGDAPLDTELYKNGATDRGWTVSQVGTAGYMAVSPTRSSSGAAMSNRLLTPFFTVEEADAWLRFKARSVYPLFPDSYSVIIREEGGEEFATLLSVEKENPTLTTRVVSLADYAGKSVQVGFLTTSTDGYMLAVDDITAGTLTDDLFMVENRTPAYTGNRETCLASGSILNVGGVQEFDRLECTVAGECVSTQELGETLATGESIDFSLPFPATLNERTSYTVSGVRKDGSSVELTSGETFRSWFERRLMLDEGTGMWCNNCPKGIVLIEKLRRQYGDNLIVAVTHANDDLMCTPYWSELGFYAVPYFMLDRNRETAFSDARNFDKELYQPVTAEIRFKECEPGEETASIKARLRFAEDLDNSADRYRIGYTVLRNGYSAEESVDFYQENSVSTLSGEQYYFLPKKIPAALVKMENVTIDAQYAFAGIANSLPAVIAAGEDVEWEWTLARPSRLDAFDNGTMVAYVIDTEDDGRILNAARLDLDGKFSAVEEIAAAEKSESGIRLSVSADGTCRLTAAEGRGSYEIRAYDVAGNLLTLVSGEAAPTVACRLALPKGVAIVKADCAGMSATAKALIR